MMRMLVFLFALAISGALNPAWAGTSTIVVKDGNGASQTYDVVTDGSGHFGAMSATCDGTALAQCAGVKAGNTAATTDVAVVVSDANVLAAVQAAGPALNATTSTTNSYSTGQTNPLNADLHGNLYVNLGNSADPCLSNAKTNFAIGSSSGTIQIVAGSASKKVYLCSLSLIAAATAVVNVIEGTGAACATANEAAVIGSTTAASGMSLAANGGLTLGNGGGTVGVTATAANGLCILQSGTTALAGNATYVQQ